MRDGVITVVGSCAVSISSLSGPSSAARTCRLNAIVVINADVAILFMKWLVLKMDMKKRKNVRNPGMCER